VSELIIWEAKTDDEHREAFEAYLRSTLDDTRAHEGCESITVHRGIDDPNRIVLIEQWRSHDDYVKYVAWRATLGALIQEYQVEPSSYRRFENLEI
jgi:quinol monooxygenase YgiN